MHRLLTYENEAMMGDLARVAAGYCGEGEFVIIRRAFRWHKLDCGVLPNCYEMLEIDYVCGKAGLELIHDFGHFGVVKKREAV